MKAINVNVSVCELPGNPGPLSRDYDPDMPTPEPVFAKKTVKGYAAETPGLAVNRCIVGAGWSITHTRSGLAIPWTQRTRADALKAAKLLKDVLDWTITAEAIGDTLIKNMTNEKVKIICEKVRCDAIFARRRKMAGVC